jgi:hypothetical protein
VWESEKEVNDLPMEAKRYSELVERLQTLGAQRSQLNEAVTRLQRMRELLEPFSSGDDGESRRSIQENLITRDGEVEKELERMRMLLARVGGRVGPLVEHSVVVAGDEMLVDDVEVDETRKVDDLLRQL